MESEPAREQALPRKQLGVLWDTGARDLRSPHGNAVHSLHEELGERHGMQ